MKKIFLLVLMLTAIVLTGSACISGNDGESTLPDYDFKAQPSDMLTEKEMKTLLWHARQFVGRSKQIKMHANAKKIYSGKRSGIQDPLLRKETGKHPAGMEDQRSFPVYRFRDRRFYRGSLPVESGTSTLP